MRYLIEERNISKVLRMETLTQKLTNNREDKEQMYTFNL